MTQAPLIKLDKVSFGYLNRNVFENVNLELHRGERLALLGGNGAGKSTLLQLIVGLNKRSSGGIYAFGKDRTEERDFIEVRTKAGMVFQDSDDQLFCPSVLEDVAFGPLNLGMTKQEAIDRSLQTLESLGLSELANRITHKLSGGQKRLVALATVLAMKPEVLLLDEPTNGLDDSAELRLIELLESLDQAMILVSHDQKLIERLATRAVILTDGTLVEAVLHKHPHHHEHSHVHIHAKGSEQHHAHDPELEVHNDL